MLVPKHAYRRSKVRFFEREHGTEFLRFELEQMRRFAAATRMRGGGDVELDGYVAWARPPYFVLLPTQTVANIHVVCRAVDGAPYPDMNRFSTVRGRIRPEVMPGGRAGYVLQAADTRNARPGFGEIKPDISHNDFVGLLFEKWRNVAGTTQQLIAHSLTSSPAMPDRRAGGFTVTIDSLSKRVALGALAGDLRRFVPAEVRAGRAQSLALPEMGRVTGGGGAVAATARLPTMGWDSSTAPLERMPDSVSSMLDRRPVGGSGGGNGGTAAAGEYSVTLLKKAAGPLPLRSRGMRMSDYPAVLEEHVERRLYSYDTSAEVFKFLLAVRMHSPAVSMATLASCTKRYSGMIAQFARTHEYLLGATGSGQFLDMGFSGRPLSVYNVAASLARSRAADAVSDADIRNAGSAYIENLTSIFDVVHEGAYDRITPNAPIRYEERRAFVYLDEHPQSSPDDLAAAMGITPDDAAWMIKSLYGKSLLYEPVAGRYSTIPISVVA